MCDVFKLKLKHQNPQNAPSAGFQIFPTCLQLWKTWSHRTLCTFLNQQLPKRCLWSDFESVFAVVVKLFAVVCGDDVCCTDSAVWEADGSKKERTHLHSAGVWKIAPNECKYLCASEASTAPPRWDHHRTCIYLQSMTDWCCCCTTAAWSGNLMHQHLWEIRNYDMCWKIRCINRRTAWLLVPGLSVEVTGLVEQDVPPVSPHPGLFQPCHKHQTNKQ